MRVLFTPMAWPTHYYQMVGMVWACRLAGHDVRVAGQPPVVDAVTKTGITAVSVGGGYDVIDGVADLVRMREEEARKAGVTGPGPLPPEVFRRLLALRMVPHVRTAEDMAADLVAFAQRWQPDLVVTDPAVYAAPLAAAAAGAPLVRHLWGLDMLRHIALPGNGVSAEDDHRAEWPAELVELYERYDTKPQADVAVSTLDTCPASMQLPDVPNRMPVRYTSYNGAVVAPAWLLDPPERPRVCVTWGSSTTRLVGPEAFLVPRILEALSGLDIEVIVTIGSVDRPRLGEVPDGIRVVEGMPLELVLPTCTAIIHQSGAGATLTSAYHGVPQVTIPLVADQNMVSQRLSATGAGIGIGGNDDGLPDGGAIREAVTAIVTTDGPRDAAHRLRAEMRGQPAPSEVVRLLEELV